MRKQTIIWILLIVLVVISTPPAQLILQENYNYRNQAGTFQCGEYSGKGSSFEGCTNAYYLFLTDHPKQSNVTLYRTFTIKWWWPWNWYQLLFHNQRFRLPYWGGAEG